MPIITISENGTADYSGVEDTRLNSSAATTNYGTASDLEATSYGSGARQVSLLRFTLPGVLSGATITSATLRLTQSSASGIPQDIELFRCLRNWTVGGATWNTLDGSTGWGTAGAASSGTDIAASGSAEAAASSGTGVQYDLTGASVAADIQAWVDGATNNGWLVRRKQFTADDGKYCVLNSSNDASASTRPLLTIVYTAGSSAPVISTATQTLTAVNRTTAGATIDSGGTTGTLYALARTGGSQALAAAIKSGGQSNAYTGAGAKTVPGTVAVAGTAGQIVDLVVEDATNGFSNVVSTGTFTTASALSFAGTIPTQTVTSGAAVDIDLSSYWSGAGFGSLSYASIGASIAGTGLSINSSGHLVGTAGAATSITGVQLRKGDSGTPPSQAPSNTFTLTINAGGPALATTFTLTVPAMASLTGLKYALFDQVTPDLWAAPIKKAVNLSFNGSGVATIDVTGLTARNVGELGGLIITNSDGTATSVGSQAATRRGCLYIGAFL